ncbi:MAG: M23 family metallopeptidase [Anaerolineaceae bacterium]|nr:M23 family metallopeptidase [Anaerolineaceae bacterium]
MNSRRITWLGLLAALYLLPGCASAPAPATVSPPTAAPSPTTPPPTPTLALPSPTAEPAQPTFTPAPSLTPTAVPQACSPLQGFDLADLDDPDLLKADFAPPRPGYDDGHFGVDFSYWTDAQGQPMLGLPIQSVLAGRVAASLPDRQPYGNAVMIETPLDQLPPAWLEQLPAYQFIPQEAIGLNCPEYAYTPLSEALSLYIIYGHLNVPSGLEIGQQVSCGEVIGEVGTTGRSVNPHLHLEMRLGNSGMTFPVMGHYTNDVTDEERRLYCIWRVSGAFQPLDPLPLLLP